MGKLTPGLMSVRMSVCQHPDRASECVQLANESLTVTAFEWK